MSARSYKNSLLQLMSAKIDPDFAPRVTEAIRSLDGADLASMFVDVAFLVSAIKFAGEELWLQNKNAPKEILYSKFIKKILAKELAPVLFMHEFFESSNSETIAQSSENASLIESAVVQMIKTKSLDEQKVFATTAMRLMAELFEFEHRLNQDKQELGLQMGLSLYRVFDSLDKVFDLDYAADKDMSTSLTGTERLYEGAGVGVQTSYSTALTALRYSNPAKGSRFIDLGAGYGRVGLVVGLMRPDIEFIGYEFVGHRVDIAAKASQNFGLSRHVHFKTQDLAAEDFQIPVADTYYIYDSFSESTYQHVLKQLAQIGRQKRIAIITKGNARQQMESPTFKGAWMAAQVLDGGNLCLFRSR